MKKRESKTINMATILYFKRIVLSLQQHAYPASRQISALRVAFYFYTTMTKIPYPKHLISFSDQIALLKQRGLSFTDENKALHLLQNYQLLPFERLLVSIVGG